VLPELETTPARSRLVPVLYRGRTNATAPKLLIAARPLMLVFVLSYTPLVFTLALCYGSGEEEARSVDRAATRTKAYDYHLPIKILESQHNTALCVCILRRCCEPPRFRF